MTLRTTVCTLAGLFAVLCVFVFAPHKPFSPYGIILPTEHVRAAISPDDVIIYNNAPIGKIQKLGQVRAELSFYNMSDETRDTLFHKIKTLAASVGANGVVINYMVPDNGVRHMLMFVGTAIYLPRSKH